MHTGQSFLRDSRFIPIVNLPEAKGDKQQKVRTVGRKKKNVTKRNLVRDEEMRGNREGTRSFEGCCEG